MKLQRIRYKPHPKKENALISDKLYTVRGGIYRIEILLDSMTYRIVSSVNGDAYVSERSYTNYNVLLKKAKEKAFRLGIDMKQEIRNRTFGRCPKGYTQKEERVARRSLDEIAFKLGKKVEDLTIEDIEVFHDSDTSDT